MSDHAGDSDRAGLARADTSPGLAKKSAGVRRSMAWCLTSSTEAGKRLYISQAGLAHTFGVCLLEMAIMARGGKKAVEDVTKTGMPRFVDVKLTPEQRDAFRRLSPTADGMVHAIQVMCDEGYRFGCSWSGEHQSYTVSLTCRAKDDANNGLCMTSFAGNLETAVALALFKHTTVTGGLWLGAGVSPDEDFG
jgi:hypothetical protein